MPDRKLLRYAILLGAQTACAAIMLVNIHAGFRILIENLGTPNASAPSSVLHLLIAAAISQACYWYRLRTVPVPSSVRNIALGHLLAFASRLGFIFGGALFSVYFLRHAPALALGPLDIAWRGTLLIAVLFALYCYTLELERLGAALQAPPTT
ncbi:hypothetical protein [Bosea sp. (in: a-proteobacteria)]|uniref:hypothetical protein n=1 Tax=Bosea sp. (in: a-proteobacteria) TaxID=1871050 RepID=UPI0027363623|nr:hypothetical protein [Bosea sp. (in: a-proteobacteria)]MDP3256390.1 hypothetical protein [Bosea sp. (in: a-proteobacteria)]